MMLRASHSEDQKFVHKPDLKKPLGRSRQRQHNNIKMGLTKIVWGGYGLDSFGSQKGLVTRFSENGNETLNCIRDW